MYCSGYRARIESAFFVAAEWQAQKPCQFLGYPSFLCYASGAIAEEYGAID